MDCKTARFLLDLLRPQARDGDGTDLAALERHLAACPECAALAHAEHRAEARLARAMRDVPIPDDGRQRLLARLAADRRGILRRKASRVVLGFAAAAAVLLAVSLVSYWIATHRPALNLEVARDHEIEKMVSPRAEWVQEWFAAHRGVAMTPPAQFDYAYLAHYDMGECQGQRVPQLVFVRDRDGVRTWANVFVITKRQFDLSCLPDDTRDLQTQGFSVVILPDADSPDTAFMIIHTGETLDPLLAGRPGA